MGCGVVNPSTNLIYENGILTPVGGYIDVFSYDVIVPPASYPITLDELKFHLRIIDNSSDAYLTSLIKRVTQFAEKYTGRTFINTTYRTYREYFCECIVLKRSKLQLVNSVKYYLNSILQTVDSVTYYNSVETDYSAIYLVDGKDWPGTLDNRVQRIVIEFVAGYGADANYVPEDIKQGLLNHATQMYENRGDCDDCSTCLPSQTENIYSLYRIIDLGLRSYCR
jgi:uncharacterized phiE125 gp8 family phage protein